MRQNYKKELEMKWGITITNVLKHGREKGGREGKCPGKMQNLESSSHFQFLNAVEVHYKTWKYIS